MSGSRQAGLRGVAVAVAILFGVAALPGSLRADADADADARPHEIVRELTILQNSVARGNLEAFRSQKQRLAAASKLLLSAPVDTYREHPASARAAIKFALSGGPPTALERLVEGAHLPASLELVGRASLAYAQGRKKEANNLFKDVDVRTLDRSLGGHVALVRGLSIGGREPNEVIENLELAYVLSPGTLVEEAALRRLIALAAEIEDWDRFDRLTLRYLRRFPRSIYSSGLFSQISTVLAKGNYGGSPEKTATMTAILQRIPDRVLVAVLKKTARLALQFGHTQTAEKVVEFAKASTLLKDGAGDAWKVVSAATLIVGEDRERGVKMLEEVDPAGLSGDYEQLFNASRELSQAIVRWPDVPVDLKEEPKSEAEPQSNMNGGRERLSRAMALIEASDQLIEDVEK